MKYKALIFSLLTTLCISSWAQQAENTQSEPAPRWVLQTLDGESVNLAERIRAPQNRIMVFWATWCPFCKQLMPIVAELQQDYPELEVLSFNVFDDLDPADYAEKAPWPFVHVLEGDEFARVHGVKGLPTLFLLNDQGKMVLDLREIDVSDSAKEGASNRMKASRYAPL